MEAAGSGRMVRPSSSSVASTPHRRSSATSDPMRSVSLRRMNPTPRMRVGESANEATAARVCAVSDQSAMSTSMPSAARPSDGDRAGGPLHPGTHPAQQVDEGRVALQRRRPEPGHGDPASRDGGRRPQVRGRGRVGLDRVVGPAVAAGADGDRSLPHRHVVDAERGHHGLRDSSKIG